MAVRQMSGLALAAGLVLGAGLVFGSVAAQNAAPPAGATARILPVTAPFVCCSFSMVVKLLCTRSRSGTNPARIRSSAIAKIARSASSSRRSGSCSASYASARILLAEWIRFRSVDFSLTMRA